jgi:hypothetical protein
MCVLMSQIKNAMPVRTPRERLWDAMRATCGREFTLEDVARHAQMKVDSARDYLTGLRRAGYVQETRRESRLYSNGGNNKVAYYQLVRDTGHEAPAVNRKGEALKPRQVNEALWRSLRIVYSVTPRALASYASTPDCVVSEETANSYLQMLNRAGYLEVVKPASYANQASYRLLPHMNTGPKPPQICRAARVYDANTGQVVYQEQPELAEELREGAGHDAE